jgi:hypothetical protein
MEGVRDGKRGSMRGMIEELRVTSIPKSEWK